MNAKKTNDFMMVYVTVSSRAEAEDIAKAALEARLAACANILPQHMAIYWWEGEIDSAQETVLIFKTRADLFKKLEKLIAGRHTYDCPCIIGWPITEVHQPFAGWIHSSIGE